MMKTAKDTAKDKDKTKGAVKNSVKGSPADLLMTLARGLRMTLARGLPSASSLKPRTLATRATLITTMPILLLGAIMTWFFFDRHWDTQTRQIARAVSGELLFLAQEMEQNRGDADILDFYNRHFLIKVQPLEQLPPITRSCFGSCAFLLKAARPVLGSRQIIAQAESRGVTTYIRLENQTWLRADIAQKRLSASTTLLFAVFVLMSTLILGTVSALFLQSQVRSIKRLATAMDAFGKGDPEVAVRHSGASEVRTAIRAFEEMKLRITVLVQQRSQMLAGVSHDLKSVLARMNLAIPALGKGKFTASIKNDIHDMEAILNSYLNFARSGETEPLQKLNLSEELEWFAAKYKNRLRVEVAAGLFITSRRLTLRRVFANLVDNAVQYGKRVEVTAKRHTARGKAYVLITVEDDGPGIPHRKRQQVLRPFYRLDVSRTPGKGGSGLGLAIVRDGVAALGGELKIGKSSLGGVKASVRLPYERRLP